MVGGVLVSSLDQDGLPDQTVHCLGLNIVQDSQEPGDLSTLHLDHVHDKVGHDHSSLEVLGVLILSLSAGPGRLPPL